MTNLHIDVTETSHTTRRPNLTSVLAVGAFAAAAVVGAALPAQAAVAAPVTGIATYHVAGTGGAGSPVVKDPRSATATTITRLADGAAITIDCGVRGRSVRRDTVWHHITSPVSGYIANYYTNTPGINRFVPGEATCAPAATPAPTTTPTKPATTPTTSTPVAVKGATINYNEGIGGSCVYYAMDRFHQVTGVYPKAFGDARYLASGAAASGWTVSTTPRVDSLVVFQPGQNGAGAPTGHAAWVEQISGERIYVAEMNAPTAWVVSHRWLTPATGVQYIYTS